MVSFLRVAIAFWGLTVSSVFARNGCRQCSGIFLKVFASAVTEGQARDYLKSKLSNCATGDQYAVTKVVQNTCTGNTCKVWNLSIDVYRYCGNGPTVGYSLNPYCKFGKCFYGEVLQLQCTKSVDCAATCHCEQCHC